MTTPTLTPQSTLDMFAQAPVPHADTQRRQQMQVAWQAYHGQFPRPLKVKKSQPDDNVIINRCAPIVKKGVSFLFGPVLKIEATDEKTSESSSDAPTPIQDYLDGLWGDDDDRMTLLSKLATNGGVCGQAFLKIIPPKNDSMKFPRLVVMDPELLRIVTSPDDCELILAYIIEYPLTNDRQKRQIIARMDPDGNVGNIGEYDLSDSWVIADYIRTGGMGLWSQVGTPDTWDYPFAPIFSCQNLPLPNETWGESDLTPDIIELNKVINFVQSNTSRIIRYHAHPKTWAKGIGPSQMSIDVDDVIVLQSQTAEIGTLEMTSDLGSSMTFASTLRSDMDEESRVPAVALGRMTDMPKGNISGVALQLLFQPLLEKTVLKQRMYGKLIREVSRAALIIANLIDATLFESYGIDVHFPNLLPVDDLAAAQTALILIQLGISPSTVQQQLGYNPDDEAAKNALSDAQKALAFSRGQGLPPTVTQGSQQAMQTIQQDAQMQQKAGEAA